MDVNLELYKIFYTVAKEGSISQASNILYISQPAVTIQIKKLEKQLGISLFTRTKHGVNLTNEGKILYEHVKCAINNIKNGENIISNLRNLDYGTIRIGASTTICRYILMPYLEKFHQKYSNIDIEINNNTSNNLIKELRNGNLDILILFTPTEDHKDLKLTTITKVQDIFVGNKKYYDLANNDINKLIKLPLIFPNSSSSSRKHLNKYIKDNDIKIKPKLEAGSYNLIVDLIKTGFGIGFVTKEFIQEELIKENIFEIKIKPEVPKRTIVYATIDKKEPNFSVKKLTEMITII